MGDAYEAMAAGDPINPTVEVRRLRTALRAISADMHNTSMRPCPTCEPITKVLGEPFGCYAYQAKYKAGQAGQKGEVSDG